jgi:hypothetical protein
MSSKFIEGNSGIKYPILDWPEKKNPLRTAYLPVLRSNWLMAVGPQPPISIDQDVLDDVYLGSALDCLICEDGNVFTPLSAKSFKPELGRLSGERLAVRFKWEAKAPNLPENIRMEMVMLIQELSQEKLTTFEQWKAGLERFKKIRGEADADVKRSPRLASIIQQAKYFNSHYPPALQAAWEEYQSLLLEN